jgi:hypothetical protein
MRTARTAPIRTTRPIESVSRSDVNEAGKAVLRSCCVELFAVARNALELLLLACSTTQHPFFEQNDVRNAPSC